MSEWLEFVGIVSAMYAFFRWIGSLPENDYTNPNFWYFA